MNTIDFIVCYMIIKHYKGRIWITRKKEVLKDIRASLNVR